MGFDSRHLVFEFLADNRTLNITQLTLVLFGKKTDPFLQASFNTAYDKIFAYHSKGTRLFWKDYDYDALAGTIIELLLDMKMPMNLTKEEIDFEIKEPYYFLDLREFNFEYLSAIPLYNDDELMGFTLLYTTTPINEDKYPLVALKRLLRNIVKNENSAKYAEFETLLANQKAYIDFGKTLYLSKELAFDLQREQCVLKDKDAIQKKLLENNYIEIAMDNSKYPIHILEKDVPILKALDELDKPKEYSTFTLFYVRSESFLLRELFDYIAKQMRLFFGNVRLSFYKISENSIAILIGRKYLKKDISNFKKLLKSVIVIGIRDKKDINSKTNLMYVLKYLDNTQKEYFDLDEYLAYRLIDTTNKYLDDEEKK